MAYGALVMHRENLMDVALDDAGLACAQVTHNQNLVQVFFERCLWLSFGHGIGFGR